MCHYRSDNLWYTYMVHTIDAYYAYKSRLYIIHRKSVHDRLILLIQQNDSVSLRLLEEFKFGAIDRED